MRTRKAFLLLLGWIAFAAGQRPRDPWIFEGALDGKPRMVFLALNKEMTVAYDEEGCSLYLAWNGSAKARKEISAAPPEADYDIEGPIYHRRLAGPTWSVRDSRGNVPVTPKFIGFKQAQGQAEFAYLLELPGGRKIKIEETPEFDNHYGDNALFRNFQVTGIPQGDTVCLALSGKGMIETWGGGATGRLEEKGGRWFFIQENDGETPIKVTWSPPEFESRWKQGK